jgi:hypothetical protein
MAQPKSRLPSSLSVLRVALVVFVVAWIFGPYALRAAVPIGLVFLIALGLEVGFFAGALRTAPAPGPDRGPEALDRERYGYAEETDELLLVRDRGEEFWIPYSGETVDELDGLVAEARMRHEQEAAVAPVSIPERAGVWPPVRRLLTGLAVVGALALIFWVVESRTGWEALDRHTRDEAAARFSDEASRIAGKPVTVHCDESGAYVGVVQHADGAAVVGGDVAYLTPDGCLDLYRLAFENEVTSSQTARALTVLAHEAWHLRGVRDEGTTECYALQSGVEVGRRLGLSEDAARQMMRQQLAENTLRRRGTAEYVVPTECRDGGRLDLHPNVSQFP